MKCLACKKEIESAEKNKWFPACSKECDLYCWLNGKYCIPECLEEDLENLLEEDNEKFD